MFRLFVFVALVIQKAGCILLPPDDEDPSKIITSCIRQICSQFVPEDRLVLLMKEGSEHELSLAELPNMTILVLEIEKLAKSDGGRQIFVAQFENMTEFNYEEPQKIWEPSSKFIFVLKKIEENISQLLPEIVEFLAQKEILNFLIISLDPADLMSVKMYTWFPFDDDNCKDNFTEFELIGSYTNGELHMEKDPFSAKFPSSYKNCLLKVMVVIFPPFVNVTETEEGELVVTEGIEVSIINLLSKRLKFNIEYLVNTVPSDWGYAFSNGTTTGTLAALSEKRADLCIGGFAVDDIRVLFFEYTPAFLIDAILWVVPYAQTVPEWRLLIDALDYNNYILPAMLVIFSCLCWLMSLWSPNEFRSFNSLAKNFENMYAIAINLPPKIVPRTSQLRILFLMYFVYSLMSVCLYGSTLTSYFTKPIFEKQIKTLQEILHHRLEIVLPLDTDLYLFDSGDPDVKRILKWTVCYEVETCFNETSQHKAVLESRSVYEYLSGVYMKQHSLPASRAFSDIITIISAHFLMRKNYFMRDRINDVMSRILAAGLVEYWSRGVVHYERKKFYFTRETKVLRVIHLHAAFYILIVGLLIAFVTFIVEMIVHYKLYKKIMPQRQRRYVELL